MSASFNGCIWVCVRACVCLKLQTAHEKSASIRHGPFGSVARAPIKRYKVSNQWWCPACSPSISARLRVFFYCSYLNLAREHWIVRWWRWISFRTDSPKAFWTNERMLFGWRWEFRVVLGASVRAKASNQTIQFMKWSYSRSCGMVLSRLPALHTRTTLYRVAQQQRTQRV